jgi:ribonuclease VapC
MIVVDASAIVAIIADEPDSDALIGVLQSANAATTSPIAVYEAALALRRLRRCSIPEAEAEVAEFLSVSGVEVIAVAPEAAHAALEAFARYGKGGGHPAQLNLGDCFAYAQAKTLKASLLFKGDDFSATDLARAV